MDVHGQGHYQTALLELVFAPGDDRSQKGSLVEHMDIKMTVVDPRQTGHIKKVGRLMIHNAADILIFFLVPHKAGMKFQEVFAKRCDQLGALLVVLVKNGVAGGDGFPSDEVSLRVPAVLKVVVGIDNL